MEKISEIDRIIAGNILAIIGNDYGVQKKLASDAKINPITLNRILKLRQRAGRDVVLAIAKALNVSEESLYQIKSGPKETPATLFEGAVLLLAFEKAPLRDRLEIQKKLRLDPESIDADVERFYQLLEQKEPKES